jgi:hypothetical protein
MDLAPTQPTYLPLNCSFLLGDITDPDDNKRFSDDSIDLVHMRFILSLPFISNFYRQVHAGLTEDSWPVVIGNIYKMLKSGTGWVQVGEVSSMVSEAANRSDSPLWQVFI